MKLDKFAKMQKNRRTNQISFNLRIKELRKAGLTPSDLLNVHVPKNLIQVKSGRIYK